MIKIEGLSKFFRTEEFETIALNKVSLEVKEIGRASCRERV